MRRGFTLVELMIVIAVIAVVAAIALPNLMSSQRAANERSAASTIRMISTAEYDFRSNDRDRNKITDFWTGDLSGLNRLMDAQGNPIALIELPVAQMDGNPLPAGSANGLMGPDLTPQSNKAGYWVMALEQDAGPPTGPVPYMIDTDGLMGLVHNSNRYGYIAYAEAYGTSGSSMFITNEEGTVFRRDPGQNVVIGAAPPFPIQAAYRNYPNNALANGWGKLD